MKRFPFFTVSALLFLSACTMAEFRVGQKKVPDPIAKTDKQIEGERQAADLLAKGIKEPPSLKPVAQGLSDSLGKPEKPLVSTSPTTAEVDTASVLALQRLESGMVKMQQQIEAQNKFIAKYSGTKLEGTGFDLMGPGSFLLVVGLIVLAVLCPPIITLMFFALRRLKAAAGIVVNEIESAAKDPEAKAAVAKIKANVAAKMQSNKQPTSLLKNVITNLKS